MPENPQETKPEQLERYIRESQRTQRQLGMACALGVVIAVVTWMFSASVGWWLLIITVFVGGTGYYITGMHIHGWQHELYELRRVARKRRARSGPG